MAYAQSAADKATARELAADGIKKFKAGNPRGALKSLQKAQALYDAPIHLVYIARAQTQLGMLVEAAESYRSLARVQLGPDAPDVFKKAQREGHDELLELEPRIARLTIDIDPEEPPGLTVTVDGDAVNNASLSVARPTNPGKHQIQVSASGYEDSTQEVELGEGGEATVDFSLVKSPFSDAVEETGEPGTGDQAGASWRDSGPMGLILGMRLGVLQPLGMLEKNVPIDDLYGTGGFGTLEVGFRFLHYLGLKFYGGGGFTTPGPVLEAWRGQLLDTYRSTVSARSFDAGMMFMVTSNPRRFGGFAQAGLSFIHGFSWRDVVRVEQTGSKVCVNRARQKGLAGRLGAGVNIPVQRLVTIVPEVDFSLGSMGKRDTDFGCTGSAPDGSPWPAPPEPSDATLDKAMSFTLFFALGIDLHLGDEWFQ
jgi:hypothetical protein